MVKAKIIKRGIIKISVDDLLIKSSLIAGSSKYATDEVLAANINEKKTDIKIFSKYLLV